MILTTLAASLALGLPAPGTPLYCPVTLQAVKTPVVRMVYAGCVFGTCCPNCEGPFEKDPAGFIAKAAKANKTVGFFQFDPVSGLRIESAQATASTDYKAIRYYFSSREEKKKFDAAPVKFVGEIKGETYHCPVMESDTTFAEAQSYADYRGVRYFMCCAICVSKLRPDPAKYVKNSADKIKPLSALTMQKP